MNTRTVYVVLHTAWEYNDGWHYSGGDTPVNVFAERQAAEVFHEENEKHARRLLRNEKWYENQDNFPWWSENLYATFGPLSEISSLSEEAILTALRDKGLPIPPDDMATSESTADMDRFQWWDGKWWSSLWMTAEAMECSDAVWDIFDGVRFFEVVAMEWDG